MLIGRVAAPSERLGASPLAALLSLIGVASFVLPPIIGFLCQTWRAAVVLPVAAWWVALIAHALAASAALKVTQIPYLYPVPVGNAYYAPFWLNSTATIALLLSFALFGTLGLLGWIARQALHGER